MKLSYLFFLRYPARARYDKQRDRYVTERMGYEVCYSVFISVVSVITGYCLQVVRIPLEGNSPDEIVALIHNEVLIKTELIEDAAIQSIYSRDQSKPPRVYVPRYLKQTDKE
jgi:hypothetical protein